MALGNWPLDRPATCIPKGAKSSPQGEHVVFWTRNAHLSIARGFFLQIIRSYLKIRIFVRDQDEAENQPGGILQYVEDLRRGLNADIGRKDFFEMASRNMWRT